MKIHDLKPAPGSNRRRIIASLWPDPAEVETGTRGDLSAVS